MTRFIDDRLWVSWIDREGQILSSGCSFFEELSLTLALLLILQRFGRRQWGYVPELNTEDRRVLLHPVNPDGTLGKDKVAINFDPDDEVYSTWTLFSRATNVVGANKDRGGKSSIAEGTILGRFLMGLKMTSLGFPGGKTQKILNGPRMDQGAITAAPTTTTAPVAAQQESSAPLV